MNFDTPRTDAVELTINGGWVRTDFARQLERELTVSLENQVKTQAEVERLKEIAEGLAYTGCPIHRGYWKSKLREPLAKPLR